MATAAGTGTESERGTETATATDTDVADAGTGTSTEVDMDAGTDNDASTDSDTETATATVTDTQSASDTGPDTETATISTTDTNTATATSTMTASETATATSTMTASETATATETATDTDAETCEDGVQNQDETGVDCGGASCPPCPCANWRYTAPEQVTGVGSSGDFYGPNLSHDGLTLYYSRYITNDDVLYMATRTDRGTVFSNAAQVANVNSGMSADVSPHVTSDGLSLYLASDRMGGMGDRDIMVASRAIASDPFSTPTFVTALNSASEEQLPWVSDDRLTVLFVSRRLETGDFNNDANIWMATRGSVDDPFSGVTALDSVNSPSDDGRGVLTPDGLAIYFSSDRPGGMSDHDLYTATRPDTQSDFGTPVSLADLNSNSDDVDVALSSDGAEIFFTSERSGDMRIYRALRECADEDSTAYRTETAMVIDGVLDEAPWAPSAPILHVVRGTLDDEAYFDVLWDDQYLYIGVAVHDDLLSNDHTDYWGEDGVDIAIDGDDDGGAALDGDDLHCVKSYDDSDLYCYVSGPTYPAHTGSILHGWSALTGGGYAVEIAVPWTELGITPSGGVSIGFDLGVRDDDSQFNSGLQNQLRWHGDVDEWWNTNLYGEMVLNVATAP